MGNSTSKRAFREGFWRRWHSAERVGASHGRLRSTAFHTEGGTRAEARGHESGQRVQETERTLKMRGALESTAGRVGCGGSRGWSHGVLPPWWRLGVCSATRRKGWPTQCPVCPETLQVGSGLAGPGASRGPRQSSSPSQSRLSQGGEGGNANAPPDHHHLWSFSRQQIIFYNFLLGSKRVSKTKAMLLTVRGR